MGFHMGSLSHLQPWDSSASGDWNIMCSSPSPLRLCRLGGCIALIPNSNTMGDIVDSETPLGRLSPQRHRIRLQKLHQRSRRRRQTPPFTGEHANLALDLWLSQGQKRKLIVLLWKRQIRQGADPDALLQHGDE